MIININNLIHLIIKNEEEMKVAMAHDRGHSWEQGTMYRRIATWERKEGTEN